ncbi:MAG: hypothetical protein FWD59_01635 [Micrococcales bacterium]|nr:hypothetical protein [Micrococcales bacterium]
MLARRDKARHRAAPAPRTRHRAAPAPRTRRRTVLTSAFIVSIAVSGLLTLQPTDQADAANIIPFTARFSANADGAIQTIGNALLTCPDDDTRCAGAKTGTSINNNSFQMVYIDADNDPTTYASSSSRLLLPTGATVLWAGLYWGARLNGGASSVAATGDRTKMRLRPPGFASYQTVSSDFEFGPNSSSMNAYQEYADVTSLVQTAGGGEYWGADVSAATGADRYAGWSLTVVYRAPGLPLRNLTVFDGFDAVKTGTQQVITVSGFTAPLAGEVATALTMVAYEGDRAESGDYVLLNNTQLATPLSPGSNFFNSTIDNRGQNVTTRNPAYINNLGIDIKQLAVTGVIPNGATEATFTFSSSGDLYYPGVLSTAINLYAPDFTASSKTAVNLSGNDPAMPGDTIQYTLSYVNHGQDPADKVISSDPLPPGVTYVPGSLRMVQPAIVPLTDAPGDDGGEYSGGVVTVRLGQGADEDDGGWIAIAETYTYQFLATVNGSAGGSTIANTASLDYETATTNTEGTYDLPATETEVGYLADVSLTKSMTPATVNAGSNVTATLVVTNLGPTSATGVVVHDTLPPDMIPVSASVPGGTCPVPPAPAAGVSAVITCSLGTLVSGDDRIITIVGRVHPASPPGQIVNRATVSADSHDPDLTDNTDSASVTVTQSADLSITKTTPATAPPPGSTVTYTMTLTNLGPSTARDVVITDTVSSLSLESISLISATGSSGVTCPATVTAMAVQCTVDSLAPSGVATVTVVGWVSPAAPPGGDLIDEASVTSSTPDPVLTNNSATVTRVVGTPQADMAMVKTGPSSAVAGEPISFTLEATNRGPADATAVVVSDTLPAAITATAAIPTRGSCVIVPPAASKPPGGTQTVTCSVGTIPGPSGPGATQGGLISVGIEGTIDSATPPGALTNTASVDSAYDPVGSNNSSTWTTTVTESADLQVSKVGSITTIPSVGGAVVYTVTVKNLGPSTARGATLTDLLPVQLTFGSASATGMSCANTVTTTSDPAFMSLTCTIASLAAGAEASVAISTVAGSGVASLQAGDTLVETATVNYGRDPNSDNNVASWTLSADPQTDLVATKESVSDFVAGKTAVYTLTAENKGAWAATTPVLMDALPDGVHFVSSASGCVGPSAGTTVTCPLGPSLAAGNSASVSFTVRLDADLAPGTALRNWACVASPTPDPAVENNCVALTTYSSVEADITVIGTQSVTVPPPATYNGPGSARNQTFTITNDGPSVARSVTFRANLAVEASIPSPIAGAIFSTCRVTNKELICEIDNSGSAHSGMGPSDLWPGESVTVTIPSLLVSYATPGTYPANAAQPLASGAYVFAMTTTHDPNQANNADVSALVVGAAQTALVADKTALALLVAQDGHQAFVAGSTFAYRITVGVAPGPSGYNWADAQGATLVDPMPPGFTATSVATDKGTCTITTVGTHRVECDFGTLFGVSDLHATPPVVTVLIRGTIAPTNLSNGTPTETRYTNTATPGATTPTTSVTPGTAIVDVVNHADLSVIKTADTPTFPAGALASWTITVVNAGPSNATGAVVTDVLPPGLTYDWFASSPGWPTCIVWATTPADDPNSPGNPWMDPWVTPAQTIYQETIRCTLDLAAGESRSIRLAAQVPSNGRVGSEKTPYLGCSVYNPPGTTPTCASTVTNRAEVSHPSDQNPGNNISTPPTVTPVSRIANLVTKASGTPDSVVAGGEVIYTITVSNAGPAAAENAVGAAVFPRGFQLVSYSAPSEIQCHDELINGGTQVRVWCMIAPDFDPWFGLASPPGGSSTASIVMRVPLSTPAGVYTTQARASTTTAESTYVDNVVNVPVNVILVADTRVTKRLVTNPIEAGRAVTYRFDIDNLGPNRAQDVTLSDTLPSGTSLASASLIGGGDPHCVAPPAGTEDPTITCSPGSLDPGQSMAVLITMTTIKTLTGNVANTSLVGAAALDPRWENNHSAASALATQRPQTDVGVALSPSKLKTARGTAVTITATVTNRGPAQAVDTVVTFTLPPGLTGATVRLKSSSPGTTPAACTTVGTLVTCQIGTLEVGDQVVYQIKGKVSKTAKIGSAIVLAASVDHAEIDPNLANDTASATITVVRAQTPRSPSPTRPTTDKPGGGGDGTGASPFTLLFALAALLLTAVGGAATRRRRSYPARH